MTDWCILLVNTTATIRLAASLVEAGYDAWTPIDIRERWAGKPRQLIDQEVAAAPGYVFARDDRLSDLLALSREPALCYQVWDSRKRCMVTKGLPVFRIMPGHQGYAKARDRLLAPLREFEQDQRDLAKRRQDKARCKGPVPKFYADELVRCDGAYAGLDLTVVETTTGKMVKVSHETWLWTVEISAWKLRSVNVTGQAPEQGEAALAA